MVVGVVLGTALGLEGDLLDEDFGAKPTHELIDGSVVGIADSKLVEVAVGIEELRGQGGLATDQGIRRMS